jgi:hypothetical protein
MPTKLTLWVLGIVLAVIFYTCWRTNGDRGLDATLSVQKDAVKPTETSSSKDFSADDQTTLDRLNDEIAANRFVSPYSKLKSPINDFGTAWKNKKRLSTLEALKYKDRIDDAFNSVILHYKLLNIWRGLAVLFMLLIIMSFICLAATTNLLRDIVGNTKRIDAQKLIESFQNNPDPVRSPFSLARTQLGFWISTIACIYIYAVLWDQYEITTINNTALLLMGISAGTFATGAIIDTAENATGIPRSQDEPGSGNFLKDILSDNDGISIHRFQNVVWTIIAIIIYIYRYTHPKALPVTDLPELDSTLIALTGISSATYLTMKVRENVQGSTDKLDVKITLVPDPALSPEIKTALLADSSAFNTATVTLLDATGADKLPVPAASPTAKYDFELGNVSTGRFQKVDATWSGLPDGKGNKATFSGSYDQGISSKTSFPIIIYMKQQN